MEFSDNFLVWNLLCFDLDYNEIYSQGFNWQYDNIDSDNGLVRNKRQAIVWNNAGLVGWSTFIRHYISMD